MSDSRENGDSTSPDFVRLAQELATSDHFSKAIAKWNVHYVFLAIGMFGARELLFSRAKVSFEHILWAAALGTVMLVSFERWVGGILSKTLKGRTPEEVCFICECGSILRVPWSRRNKLQWLVACNDCGGRLHKKCCASKHFILLPPRISRASQLSDHACPMCDPAGFGGRVPPFRQLFQSRAEGQRIDGQITGGRPTTLAE